MSGLLLMRPARRARGRRWLARDPWCPHPEHYREFPDCRCQVFANKALAEAYVDHPEART